MNEVASLKVKLLLPRVASKQSSKIVFDLFGLCGKLLAAGVASVRDHRTLSPCWTESAPACSNMEHTIAKAEPISNTGDISLV